MNRKKIFGPTRVARIVARDEYSKVRVYISVRTNKGLIEGELDKLKQNLVEKAFEAIKSIPYCAFSIANAKQVNAQEFDRNA
jgi:hypothetical protein